MTMPQAHAPQPRPRASARLFAAGDGAVVFCEAAQNLYALDSLAAFCWLELEAGEVPAATAGRLADAAAIGEDEARRRVDAVIGFLGEANLLDDGAPAAPAASLDDDADIVPPADLAERLQSPAESILIHLLGICGRVDLDRSTVDMGLMSMLRPLGVASNVAPRFSVAIVADGERLVGCIDGRPVAETGPAMTPAALLEMTLYRALLTDNNHLLTIHCGALAVATETGLCWLALPAPSGSGKTTLTTALAAAGYPYGTDELLVLDYDLKARPLAVPPCVKETSWPVLADRVAGLMDQPVLDRYGRRVRYAPIGPVDTAPARRLAALVFPRYGAKVETRLQPLAPIAAMQRLFDQCLSIPKPLDHATVGRLVAWCNEIPAYTLELSDLDIAISLLRGLAPPAD